MYLKITLWVLSLAIVGCGQSTPVSMPTLTLEHRLSTATASLVLYVYKPNLSDGTILLCRQLNSRGERLDPDDARLEVLAKNNVAFDGSATEFVLDEIAAGEGRVVFVEAQNKDAEVIGRGCTQGIEVAGGDQSENVQVLVFAVCPDNPPVLGESCDVQNLQCPEAVPTATCSGGTDLTWQ